MPEETLYAVSHYLHGWTEKADEMRHRAQSAWSKRRRQKLVICPITGEDTDHMSGVSGKAWQLIHRGVKALEHDREIAGEKKLFYAHGAWLTSFVNSVQSVFPERRKTFERMDYLDLIRALTQEKVVRVYRAHDEEMTDRLEANPIRGSGCEAIRLTERQAEAVRTFGAALEALLDQTAQENYRKGSALLVRMASGDIGIDEINAASTRREKIVRG